MNRLPLSPLTAAILLPALGLAQPPPAGGVQDPGKEQPKGAKLLPIPQIVAFRREQPIVVDGSLIDWQRNLPAIDLTDQRLLSGTANGAWNGPTDCSAYVFLQWDDDFLWFACSVKDEWHFALDADTLRLSEIPAADNVVLTIDPGRDTRAIGPDPGRVDDREFWFADEPSRTLVLWDRLRGSADVLKPEEGQSAVSRDKEIGLTTYEAKIPWSRILPVGAKAASGLTFDMQVVVNDCDEATDSMPQTRIGWTFGCHPVVRPGILGAVMLVADEGALAGNMPEFPVRPATKPDPVPGPGYWRSLIDRLAAQPPTVHTGARAPEEAGSAERFKLLEELDDHFDRFPRVDFLEYCQRIQRRMIREVAGATETGLPWFWFESLKRTAAIAADEVQNDRARLFRLPMGGWLVRTPRGGFLVDPAGADLLEVWGAAEFVVLTQPLDMTRRSDPLLLRMAAAKPPRRFLTHVAIHLPLINMDGMPLVQPGQDLELPNGLTARSLGRAGKDGEVPYSLSYLVRTPGGVSMLFVGPSSGPQDVVGQDADVIVLSPRNPQALAIAAAANSSLIVLDDAFLCQSMPVLPRVTLRSLHALQKALQPRPSIVLAPGEAWEIQARRR